MSVSSSSLLAIGASGKVLSRKEVGGNALLASTESAIW